MPPSERAQKGYMLVGMVVWFITRWVFYILVYVIAFIIGGMDGPILQRLQNIPIPRIQLKPRSPQVVLSEFKINYYTVLTGAFLTQAQASAHQSRLAGARVKSHVVIQNNQYYVCVGRYTSAREANIAFEKLRDKGFVNAIVAGPVQ